jgi:nucleoside-diphosphate-sugar epimerase
MRVLVLGGTQWLGSAIATAAVARGHDVTALARGESGPVPPGVTLVRADRTAEGAYDAVSGAEWDAVIDVARQPGQVRSAVAALGSRAGNWVFVSSCSVYAAHDQPGADESAELLPAHQGDVAGPEAYGEGKAACEQAVLEARGREGCLIARAGLIGGPGDHSDRTGYWPLRLAHPATDDGSVLVPDTPTLGTQVIDVRDLAGWLVESSEVRRSGVLNAAGDVIPFAEHLATARAVAGTPARW